MDPKCNFSPFHYIEMEEIFHNYQAKAPKKRREENQKFKKINLPKKKEYDRVVEMVYKEEPAVVKKK